MVHLALWVTPILATFAKGGCYPKLALLGAQSKGQYKYQLNGWCSDQCKGSAVAALINGDTCYCADTLPLGSLVLDLNCNAKCSGYPSDNCGGSDYFYVLTDSLVQASSASPDQSSSSNNQQSSAAVSISTVEVTLIQVSTQALTVTTDDTTTDLVTMTLTSVSTTPTTSSTMPTSTTSTISTTPTTTSTTPTTTSSATTSSTEPALTPMTTVVSTLTADGTDKPLIIYKTIYNAGPTSSPDALDSTTSTSATPNAKTQKKLGISGGAIAGAVVGLVCGVALIAGLVFGLLWYRRKHDDDDLDFEDQFTLSGPEKPVAPPPPTAPNPFLTAGGYTFANTQASHSGTGAITTNLLESLKNHSRTTSHGFILLGEHLLTLDGDYHGFDDRHFQQPPEPVLARKLLNGLLPDMVARQPGSLKVVNN